MKTFIAGLLFLHAAAAFAGEAEDKDILILQLRRKLAQEHIERLRLDYKLTVAEHNRLSGEIAKRQKAKAEGEKKTEDAGKGKSDENAK